MSSQHGLDELMFLNFMDPSLLYISLVCPSILGCYGLCSDDCHFFSRGSSSSSSQ